MNRALANARVRIPRASRIHASTSPRPLSKPQSVCIFCAHRNAPQVTRRDQSSSASATTSASPPPSPDNTPSSQPQYYTLFPQTLSRGAPPSGPFTIDLRPLHREFLRLQSASHPDLHPSELKTRYQAQSALINSAYKTLQSPLLRAQYLLRERGIDAEDEAGKVEDKGLLMEVMEAREEIEEAEVESEIQGLKEANEGRIRRCEEELERLFGSDDLEGAKTQVIRLRYWINVRDALQGWEPGKPLVLQH